MSKRPLSPHLQIYKPQLTSVLSITHRATGVGLSVGLILFVGWLYALASGPQTYECFINLISHPLGKTALFLWSYALFYHLCNGIRHLFWDAGMGFELRTVYRSGWAVVIISIMLTTLVWGLYINQVSLW